MCMWWLGSTLNWKSLKSLQSYQIYSSQMFGAQQRIDLPSLKLRQRGLWGRGRNMGMTSGWTWKDVHCVGPYTHTELVLLAQSCFSIFAVLWIWIKSGSSRWQLSREIPTRCNFNIKKLTLPQKNRNFHSYQWHSTFKCQCLCLLSFGQVTL